MAIGEVGALTGLALNPKEETEEEDGLFRFNVYQNLTGPAKPQTLEAESFKMCMEPLPCQCMNGFAG